MRQHRLRPFTMAACMLFLVGGYAQVTTPANIPGTPNTDFVGWDNSVQEALEVRHDGNWPIEWYTDALRRMFLHQTLVGQTVNGYTGVDLSGNLGIGLFNATAGSGPITRPLTLLHLDNGGTEDAGFRDWMRTGVTMSHISDMMYVGLKQDTAEINTAAIVWSDNNQGGTIGPDRLRFIFTRVPVGGTVAASHDGLEIARMIPAANGNEGFVGIGDWQSVAWNANPVERLDVLDGRVRIRQLPNDPAAVDSFYVMVVDRTMGNERGVVKWVAATDLPGGGGGGGGTDCDWVVQAPNPHVSSVYPGTACPWAMPHGVGIGRDVPRAKLHVFHNDYSLLGRTATWSRVVADDMANPFIGVLGESGPNPMDEFVGHVEGVQGYAYNGKMTWGVKGHGYFDSPSGIAGRVVGVEGIAELANGATNNFLAGVVGRVIAPPNTSNVWAGWFDGDVWIQGDGWSPNGIFTGSDEGLKTGVEDLTGALARVMQLQPKNYFMDTAAHPMMDLSTAPQIGLIAQEVEQVVPEAVGMTMYPAHFDSLGNQISEAIPLKGIDYTKIVPLLIGALKEQHAVIEDQQVSQAAMAELLAAQNVRLDQMEELLAACCSKPNDDAGAKGMIDPFTDRLLVIQPNPFTDHTTLRYQLERGGRVMLLVNSSDGKQLQVLQEATQSEGEYRYEWTTSGLAPGIYYVTLLLDGEPLVKRAVKVQ